MHKPGTEASSCSLRPQDGAVGASWLPGLPERHGETLSKNKNKQTPKQNKTNNPPNKTNTQNKTNKPTKQNPGTMRGVSGQRCVCLQACA